MRNPKQLIWMSSYDIIDMYEKGRKNLYYLQKLWGDVSRISKSQTKKNFLLNVLQKYLAKRKYGWLLERQKDAILQKAQQ